jgi:hypothetical protein
MPIPWLNHFNSTTRGVYISNFVYFLQHFSEMLASTYNSTQALCGLHHFLQSIYWVRTPTSKQDTIILSNINHSTILYSTLHNLSIWDSVVKIKDGCEELGMDNKMICVTQGETRLHNSSHTTSVTELQRISLHTCARLSDWKPFITFPCFLVFQVNFIVCYFHCVLVFSRYVVWPRSQSHVGHCRTSWRKPPPSAIQDRFVLWSV